jgi:dolichol-phosphate mannosyltransferase
LVIALIAALQLVALVVLLARLAPGRHRRLAPEPRPEDASLPDADGVSVILPTYNEAARVGPCLAGLATQGPILREILVVDSRSTDGTGEVVRAAAARDPRVRLVQDPPRPDGWIGKVWALQHGFGQATSAWVLGVDADTSARPGMVAAVVHAAREYGYDVVSFAPRFAGMTALEQWLQPSMLLTLVYRFGAAGDAQTPPDRVLANGQCFLARRQVLADHGGYTLARASWADDVTLARALAGRGVAVGFLDGSRLYDVRAYTSAASMWREWGRSFDLSDAGTPRRQWTDIGFIGLVQGLPVLVLGLAATGRFRVDSLSAIALVVGSTVLFAIRALMLLALAPSYARRTAGYWLSPLSDPLAWLRLLVSTVRRPRTWRGQRFEAA